MAEDVVDVLIIGAGASGAAAPDSSLSSCGAGSGTIWPVVAPGVRGTGLSVATPT